MVYIPLVFICQRISFNRNGFVRNRKMEAQDMSRILDINKSFIYFWKMFPQKLKDGIFKYLDFKDVMQASLVCKAFFNELGQSQVAMSKIKFRVQDDWSEDIRKMLENSPRNYTFINIFSDGGPRTTIQFFKNYPYWTHVDLESLQFAKGNDWINYVKSFPNNLEYLKLTNIKVPYAPNTLTSFNTSSVPLTKLKELHFYEDPNEIRMFVRRTGYRYAPYNALLALGEMPELKKLILCCKKDDELREHTFLDTDTKDYFKSRKLEKLKILAVGYERLNVEDLKPVSSSIKKLNLFGFEDSALILKIWNAMANTELETIAISFVAKDEYYFDDFDVVDGAFEYKEPIQHLKKLNQLILCYDKVKMPLSWYRNFFRAQSNLISLKIKWLRKDVLKSAIKMLPQLQEIHYEKFYDLSESDDDEDDDRYANDESESSDEFEELKDLEAYYKRIKISRNDINGNVKLMKRVVRNTFRF